MADNPHSLTRDESAALHRFSDVVDNVAGPLASKIREMLGARQIARYLLAPADVRQTWNAWLWVHDAGWDFKDGIAAHLSSASCNALIAESFTNPPAGVSAAFGKLGVTCHWWEVYRGVVELLNAGGSAADFIQHADSINPVYILSAAVLPPGLRIKPVFTAVVPKEAACLGWLCKRLGVPEEELPKPLAAKIGKAGNALAIEAILTEHFGQSVEDRGTFPAPLSCRTAACVSCRIPAMSLRQQETSRTASKTTSTTCGRASTAHLSGQVLNQPWLDCAASSVHSCG